MPCVLLLISRGSSRTLHHQAHVYGVIHHHSQLWPHFDWLTEIFSIGSFAYCNLFAAPNTQWFISALTYPHSFFGSTKSILLRVRNCVGERALRCEIMVSSYMCQPNHSYVDCLFCLHSDLTRGLVVASVLHCVWLELSAMEYCCRLVATQFF